MPNNDGKRRYPALQIRRHAAAGVLLMSGIGSIDDTASSNGDRLLEPISNAWATDELAEMRGPLALRRIRGEELSHQERELLDYLDALLDQRIHGPGAPSEADTLIAAARKILART